jgi:putative ABC transport system permease protein
MGYSRARRVLNQMGMRPKLDMLKSDLRFAFRSLARAKGLAITVILTLALGIGANAAIFTIVRGVLLRPLINRDERTLIYVRQSQLGLGSENATFSVPELQDIESGVHSINQFGEFSTIDFSVVGLGAPREVRAGVVGGSYFDVMGLHPILGRLIGPHDDGPNAPGVVVLTYRFWSTTLQSDPSVIGKTLRLGSGALGSRTATIIGVLEPSIPYPTETELIANIVTSPHHLSATMVAGRPHRMTELFGRLAPGATLEQARAELEAVYARMTRDHREFYPKEAASAISVVRLREQITSQARPILLILLAASGLIYIIACSNVANLILARSIRRESELAVRAALGASVGALRRTLLVESVLLTGAGALLGLLCANPMVAILARYASRFTVRAVDLTVDSSMLWVSAGLAIVAAVLLAFIPRLPASRSTQSIAIASGGVRMTSTTNRRLRLFAITQIAASFVLLAGASTLLKTLLDLQRSHPTFDAQQVLAVDVPVDAYGKTQAQILDFYKEAERRVAQLPGVQAVAVGDVVPWRDNDYFFGMEFTGEGHVQAPGEDSPRAEYRPISPEYFATLGVPIVEGRDFTEMDRDTLDPVVIISKSVADRVFPGQDPLNHHVWWTDPVIAFGGIKPTPRRIVGVVGDVDDVHISPQPTLAIYEPIARVGLFGGRMFVRASANPYALVAPITRSIRAMAADQPIERAATLEDVKAQVLSPNRLNSLVFGGFAIVALAIAVVGVAGVLTFSVSARTREFGIRLAIGSQSSRLLVGVMRDAAVMAAAGIVAGGVCGYVLARLVGSGLVDLKAPSALPTVASALVLFMAAIAASALPAARVARIDVLQALRAE